MKHFLWALFCLSAPYAMGDDSGLSVSAEISGSPPSVEAEPARSAPPLITEAADREEPAATPGHAALHCPAQNPKQPPIYCPPLNPALPNQGQPSDELLACLKPLEVRYFDRDGKLQAGTLVVNRDLAADLSDVFDRIRRFNADRLRAGKSFFPITSILPVNQFGWSDENSMHADNSSAYNYRLKTGATDLSSLSMHSFGRAIDINTLCNPWVKTKADGTKILDPAESVDPATRDPSQPTPECSITRDTELGRAVIEAFSSHGWQWGGDWNNPKDFQHFQNPSADHETQVKRAPFCK